ncbi:MAG: helix-hairpin-helix domain-containing protein [Ignavibacteriales bacterium]|nr:helix-hairpin-helix domain-containing protein [Ignavibacteriales bacterium]
MKPSITKQAVLNELQEIPGVGKSIAEDLWEMGFRSVRELKNKNPQRMYEKHCEQQGTQIDRCLLYVFRCAVYYASHTKQDPELLKWWNWKDSRNQ